MTKKRGLSAVIVGNIDDLKRLGNPAKAKKSNHLFLPENYETLKDLDKLGLPFYFFDPIENPKSLNLLIKRINSLKNSWSTNSLISEVFEYDGENMALYLSQRLTSFFGRSLVNFEILKNLLVGKHVYEVVTFGDFNRQLSGTVAMHQNLLDVSAEVLFKIKKKRVRSFTKKGADGQNPLNNTLGKLLNLALNKFIYKAGSLLRNVKVLFVLPTNHLNLMLPVVKELERRRVNYLIVSHNLSAAQKLHLFRNSINFSTPGNFYQRGQKQETEETVKVIRKRWHASKTDFSISRDKGLLGEYINKLVVHKVDNILNFEVKHIIADYLSAKRIISLFKPKLLITTTDPDTRILPYIKIAKKNKIPSVTIQHGAYSNPNSMNFQSDKMVVWGKYYKDWFIKNVSKRSNQFIAGGSLTFDHFPKRPILSKGEEKKIKSVLILVSYYYLRDIAFEKDLSILIDELRQMRIDKIFIRTHPHQKISYIENLAHESNNIQIVNKENLDSLIQKANLVISCDTTAGINAIIASKDVIYWHFFGVEYIPLAEYGTAEEARSVDEIIHIIKKRERKSVHEKRVARNKFVEQVLHALDGKSYKRISQFILKEVE